MKPYTNSPEGYEVTSIEVINRWNGLGPGPETVRLTVGEDGVIEIIQHAPCGEGDRWYYDVHISNGNIERIFDFIGVQLKKVGRLTEREESNE